MHKDVIDVPELSGSPDPSPNDENPAHFENEGLHCAHLDIAREERIAANAGFIRRFALPVLILGKASLGSPHLSSLAGREDSQWDSQIQP